MNVLDRPWDYLIVTASNDAQAAAYEGQLRLRRKLQLLTGVRQVMVLADPGGRRVGSGGSTLFCLARILERELADSGHALGDSDHWLEALSRLRVLIVHGGGDSRRLPAYGPCGKLFVPLPGESDSAVGATLFDRLIPTYLALPPGFPGCGQVVITSGDVLLNFDSGEVRLDGPGLTGLGCFAAPEQASKHGVYAAGQDGTVRVFLQKPCPAEQAQGGAINHYGQSILDIGVLSFDAQTAVSMLQTFGVAPTDDGDLMWQGEIGNEIVNCGLDFYREICCALGEDVTPQQHLASVKASASAWQPEILARVFQGLRTVPFHVRVLPRCEFLHFGTTSQLIDSGLQLLRMDRGIAHLETCLSINNRISENGSITGKRAWVEGCRIASALSLNGGNVVAGVDVDSPTSLPEGACLDVVEGRNRDGKRVSFVRVYAITDGFKGTVRDGATFCNRPAMEWLESVRLAAEDVWPESLSLESRTVFNACIFPAVEGNVECAQWLWMFCPDSASDREKDRLRRVDRYSLAEIALLADQDAFHARRQTFRAEDVCHSLRKLFGPESNFSARDLGHVLGILGSEARAALVSRLLDEGVWHAAGSGAVGDSALFTHSRLLHTLGSALCDWAEDASVAVTHALPGLTQALQPDCQSWLQQSALGVGGDVTVRDWSDRLRASAFDAMERTIVTSTSRLSSHPRSAVRKDEIVWGRAPARLDFGGGWSDTPPQSLEHGGCVINAAIDLNGQPPIHCYARVIPDPVIRVTSIDLGVRIEISDLDDLLEFRSATSEFSLAKAALALSGFSPEAAPWMGHPSLANMLEWFGGGIELTTLAAIPKGSGLGTSSIMGAVIFAVVQRLMGCHLTHQELFHHVLRLEQALTTGGGWQDQVGGVTPGVKVITTRPGLVPDASVHYVPADILDPRTNGGRTLLYYTGVTRLAKNVLQRVVGRYLDRDRATLATLTRIRNIPRHVSEAMSRKHLPAFGELVDEVWEQNKGLDSSSTNEVVEELLRRIAPHIHGAKLAGAGGGGFLLMVCKSAEDAVRLRNMLESEPPNERARFFDFNVSHEGLVISAC